MCVWWGVILAIGSAIAREWAPWYAWALLIIFVAQDNWDMTNKRH